MHIHTSALAEMRLATHEIHASLESFLPVARRDATRSDYEVYLQDLWGCLAAFEADLWSASWPVELAASERANKLDWIESDLRYLQHDADAIKALPVARFTPDLDSLPKRFGVAYVVEGAQLGTKVLGRTLAPQLGDWSPRWLAGYGERNARNWRTFVESAERHLDTGEARKAAARAAAATFTSLAEWFRLRRNGHDRQRINQPFLLATDKNGNTGQTNILGSPI